MELLVILVCLLASAIPCLCQGSLRIVNGSDAMPKQFPYQVALYCYYTNSQKTYRLCGGTIISPRWILTAAHCLREPETKLFKVHVLAGITNIKSTNAPGSDTMWVNYNNTLVHPHYDRQTVTFDIGLIRLPRALKMSTTIQVAKLPKKNEKNRYSGQTAIVSGWGLTAKEEPSKILQYIKVEIISNKECEQEWKAKLNGDKKLWLNSHICINSSRGLPCSGDSGGPLVLDDGSQTIVGIVSHGFDPNCRIDVPDVFTRVSSFVYWIEKQTGRLS